MECARQAVGAVALNEQHELLLYTQRVPMWIVTGLRDGIPWSRMLTAVHRRRHSCMERHPAAGPMAALLDAPFQIFARQGRHAAWY